MSAPRAFWQKLGYAPTTVAVLNGEPDDDLDRAAPLPEGVTFTTDLDACPTFVHLFTMQSTDLTPRWRSTETPSTATG